MHTTRWEKMNPCRQQMHHANACRATNACITMETATQRNHSQSNKEGAKSNGRKGGRTLQTCTEHEERLTEQRGTQCKCSQSIKKEETHTARWRAQLGNTKPTIYIKVRIAYKALWGCITCNATISQCCCLSTTYLSSHTGK